MIGDAEHHQLVGVLTEHEVCWQEAAEDRRASDVRVDEIMRPASACCHDDDSMDDARHMLHGQSATSLPVVDGTGRCCGTVRSQHLERTRTP